MPSHPEPRAGRAGRMFVKLETTTPGVGGQLPGGCTVAQHLAPPHGPVSVTTTPPRGPRMTGRPQAPALTRQRPFPMQIHQKKIQLLEDGGVRLETVPRPRQS